MKKSILIIIVSVLVIALGVGTYFLLHKNNENKNNVNDNQNNLSSNEENNNSNNDNSTNDKKFLVVYYSAQNHTENVAKKIANNLNADIFEIVPKEVYTSEDLNYSNSNSRVSKEHNDESLRNIELTTTKVDNWDSCDTVLIGYPIWWGIVAWPVNNFVKDNDFSGKTVIPFCTSSSSEMGQSGKLLEDLAGNGNWKDGQRFSSSASDNDIKKFTDSL